MTNFDDLFLKGKELEKYELEKLEKTFIISREEMIKLSYLAYLEAIKSAKYHFNIYKQLKGVRD